MQLWCIVILIAITDSHLKQIIYEIFKWNVNELLEYRSQGRAGARADDDGGAARAEPAGWSTSRLGCCPLLRGTFIMPGQPLGRAELQPRPGPGYRYKTDRRALRRQQSGADLSGYYR